MHRETQSYRLIEPETVHISVGVERLEGNEKYMRDVAQIYHDSWHPEGLCPDLFTAQKKTKQFNPHNTFILISIVPSTVYAVLHTVLARAEDVAELARLYPSYNSVEKAAMLPPEDGCNMRICFSVTKKRFTSNFVDTSTGETIAPSKILMRAVARDGLQPIAFSRFTDVPERKSLLDHYLDNIKDNPKALGPAGMHEYYGGIISALLPGSRPEDRNSGGGNVLVVYPTSPEQETEFERIKTCRKAGLIDRKKIGNNWILK